MVAPLLCYLGVYLSLLGFYSLYLWRKESPPLPERERTPEPQPRLEAHGSRRHSRRHSRRRSRRHSRKKSRAQSRELRNHASVDLHFIREEEPREARLEEYKAEHKEEEEKKEEEEEKREEAEPGPETQPPRSEPSASSQGQPESGHHGMATVIELNDLALHDLGVQTPLKEDEERKEQQASTPTLDMETPIPTDSLPKPLIVQDSDVESEAERKEERRTSRRQQGQEEEHGVEMQARLEPHATETETETRSGEERQALQSSGSGAEQKETRQLVPQESALSDERSGGSAGSGGREREKERDGSVRPLMERVKENRALYGSFCLQLLAEAFNFHFLVMLGALYRRNSDGSRRFPFMILFYSCILSFIAYRIMAALLVLNLTHSVHMAGLCLLDLSSISLLDFCWKWRLAPSHPENPSRLTSEQRVASRQFYGEVTPVHQYFCQVRAALSNFPNCAVALTYLLLAVPGGYKSKHSERFKGTRVDAEEITLAFFIFVLNLVALVLAAHVADRPAMLVAGQARKELLRLRSETNTAHSPPPPVGSPHEDQRPTGGGSGAQGAPQSGGNGTTSNHHLKPADRQMVKSSSVESDVHDEHRLPPGARKMAWMLADWRFDEAFSQVCMLALAFVYVDPMLALVLGVTQYALFMMLSVSLGQIQVLCGVFAVVFTVEPHKDFCCFNVQSMSHVLLYAKSLVQFAIIALCLGRVFASGASSEAFGVVHVLVAVFGLLTSFGGALLSWHLLTRRWRRGEIVFGESQCTKLDFDWWIVTGNVHMMRMWLQFEYEIDWDRVDQYGRTYLHVACRHHSVDVVRLLFDYNARLVINLPDYNNDTALHLAIATYKDAPTKDSAIVDLLLRRGADHTLRTKTGHNAVRLSVILNQTDILQKLFDHGTSDLGVLVDGGDLSDGGVDDNLPNGFGEPRSTELHYAVYHATMEAIEVLVRNKPQDVNLRERSGHTPLHKAVDRGDPQIVQFLIDAGAEVNLSGMDGFTPLHIAALKNDLDMVKLLLENKADPTDRTQDGKSPEDLATDPKVAELLKDCAEKAAADFMASPSDTGSSSSMLEDTDVGSMTDGDDAYTDTEADT